MPAYRQRVSFGDCDPAGIVFYPNMFRWMDAAFHDYLRSFGGHAKICHDLGAIGIGAMNANASFRSPLRDGDELKIRLSMGETRNKSQVIIYKGLVGDQVAFDGSETRALFVKAGQGISVADVGSLLAILSGPRRPKNSQA